MVRPGSRRHRPRGRGTREEDVGGEGAGTRAQEPSLWLSVEEPAGQQAEGCLLYTSDAADDRYKV